MQLISGGWAAAILGAAAKNGVFNALDDGGEDAAGVAKKTGISARGAQAVLDGLTGLGLLSLSNGRYSNTPESAQFLVKGKPSYLGGMAEVMTASLVDWSTLPAAVKTGSPTGSATAAVPDNEFWKVLVPAIATMSLPVARMAADKLGLAKAGPARWLDVGGGSGVWSAVWLGANKQARGTQLDWPSVNKLAKDYVGGFGVADRFNTIDGDFHTTGFGIGYDYAIYAHIAHQESPKSNVEIFKKFRKALKPGGTLLVNDFVLSDERTGHPFAMMFSSQMLLVSKEGAAWRQADYRKWLTEAGFTSIELMPTPGPATVVFAK
ncbi:MAG TPA: methyltransferase [Elusimicrobiota bacterium]|nr:methyltransferase [Elusimicrobiota bacterium]